MRKLVVAIAVAGSAWGARARADDPRPQDTVGTWRGKAAWKGCTVTGKAQAVVDVAWKDGVLVVDLAGARDDLGAVSLVPRSDGTAAGTRDDLKVTWKPGARLTLASDAGCTANLALARDSSGIAACDTMVGLATVASTCDAMGDTRGAALDGARPKIAGWKKLRGKAKKAATDECTAAAGELETSLTQNGCLPATGAIGGATGVRECDDYISAMQRYAQCNKLPVESKQAIQQAVGQLIDAWKPLRDPKVPPEARKAAADACKQAIDALRQSGTALGCTL